ncbi:MAG: flagellar basal body P-ring formation chaperone FlgA [Bacteriovoracaceae bacterium]
MKKSLVLLTIFSSFSFASKACLIETYDQLISDSNQLNSNKHSFIKKTTCSKKVSQKFIHLIREVSGTIDQRKINHLLKEDGLNKKITIRPLKVRIIPLSQFLRNNIKIPNQLISFDNIKILDRSIGFGIDYSQGHNINCNNCDRPGLKNISINIEGEQPLWLSTTLKFKINAIVATKNISPSIRPLTDNQFKMKSIFSDRPDSFFTDLKLMKFYKSSRPISTGSAIKKNDVTKLDLVQIGKPTSIILSGSGFSISSIGIPMGNAKLHENVRLRNTKTNKIVTAEVVDFNKVKINL